MVLVSLTKNKQIGSILYRKFSTYYISRQVVFQVGPKSIHKMSRNFLIISTKKTKTHTNFATLVFSAYSVQNMFDLNKKTLTK